MFKIKNSNQGQALMMVVLVMFVGLTMVLVIFMNSLADLRLSTVEEQSERAFNITEAGIEDLLQQDKPSIGRYTAGLASLEADVNVTGDSAYGYPLDANETGEIQLNGTEGTSVDIWWTKTGSSEDSTDCSAVAGLLIEKWNKIDQAGQPVVSVTRLNVPPHTCYGVSPYNVGSQWSNVRDGIAKGYKSRLNNVITLAAGDFMIRVRPIGKGATVHAESGVEGVNLPIQSRTFVSTATAPGSDESRALEVTRTEPQLPGIFDFVLFSGRDAIVKNP